MAPSHEGSYYLPPLDQCLQSRQLSISWRSIYTSLSDPSCIATKPAIDRALKDDTFRTLLTSPWTAFSKPTPDTKSQFETRTAAINVPTHSNGHYDISELRADALWLAKETAVDEVTALRTVILEWQQRTDQALLSNWYEEEVSNLQACAAAPGIQAIQELVSLHGGSLPADEVPDAQKSEPSRRRLIFSFHLQEREYFYKAVETVAGIAQRADLQLARSALPPSLIISQEVRHVAESMWKSQRDSSSQNSSSGSFEHIVGIVRELLEIGGDPQRWPDSAKTDDSMATTYTKALLEQLLSNLRLLYSHVMATRLQSSNTSDIRLWYGLMDDFGFLNAIVHLNPDLVLVNQSIHTMTAMISTEILRITPTTAYIRAKFASQSELLYPDLPQSKYIEDEDCVRHITGCLLGAASHDIDHASPAVLAWSVICHTLRITLQSEDDDNLGSSRRNSLRDSGTKLSKAEILLKAITDVVDDRDAIQEMGFAAVKQMKVFDVLQNMLNAISTIFKLPSDAHTAISSKITAFDVARHAIPVIGYGEEVIGVLLETMTHRTPFASSTTPASTISSWPQQPAQTLREDQDLFGHDLMNLVVSRYPFELPEFLLSLGAIARSTAYVDEEGSMIARLLDNLTTFTTALPRDFLAYELLQDDDMINRIQLLQAIPFLAPFGRQQPLSTMSGSMGTALSRVAEQYSIPEGSIGKVLNESRPLVVSWDFPHSGLEYLGALLSTLSPNASLADARTATNIEHSTAADLVNLFNAMLIGHLSSKDPNAAKSLLEKLSSGLGRSDDIIRVVFDIFEDQLQDHLAQPGTEGSIMLLTRIIEFARILLEIHPERVWSMLSKTRLLPMDDSPGALAAIVGATEIPTGQFRFLDACVSLFRSLIEDCTSRAVSRSGVGTKALARFEEQAVGSGRTPEKTMSSLLFNFSRVVIDVLQSQASWRFANSSERHNINCCILNSLDELLILAHGTQAKDDSPNRLFHYFQAASANIASIYLSDSTSEIPVQALLDIFVNALAGLSALPDIRDNYELVASAVQAIKFSSSLMRTGMMQNRPGTTFRKHLYKALPLLARLYVAQEALKPHVAELLTLLVQYSDGTSEEPVSLLGYLPAQTTKSFLKVVTDIEKPLQNLETEALIWDMLSAVVSHKQQWLAISLLTGSTPRDRLKKGGSDRANGHRSLVDVALAKLSDMSALPPRRALAMLAFLSHAQRHWTWISTSISDHRELLPSLTRWLSELTPNQRHSDIEACIRNANENQTAAFVADILARFLHNISDADRTEKLRLVLPKLKYLRDHASAVDGYNYSLHKNLAKNFEQKFPGCFLNVFKRSNFRSSQLGRDYYYDLELADRLLGFDPSWKRSKGQGFVDEVARANVNFSVVDSQIALLKSWKNLALGISTAAEPEAQNDMMTVVTGCLKANNESSVPTQLFENVSELRAEFAFALLQRLIRINSKEPAVKDIFLLVWDTIRQSGLDFEVISNQRDAAYYRLLLQILFLALQPHAQDASSASALRQSNKSLSRSAATMPTPLTPLSTTFLEIISKVISTNFRALCTLVHSADPADPASTIAEESDFVLLTAMLQTILRTPSAVTMQRQIATTIAESGLIRFAMSLYSWSDSLTPHDPIYGELSILLLLTISSVPLAAEQIAVEGVLSSISTANLSQYFRAPPASSTARGGKGPFDTPARLHAIWARGILPLTLNILSAVGPGVAADVAAFLNSFPAQLARSEADLAASPSPRDPNRGSVTLGLAAELHSTALLATVIDSLRAQGAAIGINPAEVESLAFDRAGVKELIEETLKGRRGLRERIVPLGEREVGLARMKARGQEAESVLEEMVVGELKGALSCLGQV
ncbi:hypothetical protein K461DRAFT_292863 [Myriangium duriaei CBS 260.36]|uniref:Nucleoporin subcomplex protein binding to Pom34-domain-containing protein n=1 Tax=Myriangium duriaei CBS 260.36 TaxID=1168546 RepID=A0A9P4MIE4_9PEZI|nr:hypothetical protein K461DRAFT_292863 [Myriangium duriaei CBS 260.36]